MGEMRYRRRVRWLITLLDHRPELQIFLHAMLESQLPTVTQLRYVLEQDELEMLHHAVYTVGMLQLDEFTPVLIHLFETCEDQDLRERLLTEMGDLTDETARRLLMTTFQTSDNMGLRIAAAVALQDGKHPEVVAPLLALAQNTSEDARLRGYAIETIAYQGDKTIVPFLLPFLQDSAAIVRWDALYTVGQLGDMSFASYIEPLLLDTEPIEHIESANIAEDARQVLERWALQAREE